MSDVFDNYIKVLNHYGYELNNSNKMCCPNPEHHEKTPSFSLAAGDDGIPYGYCFGCGWSKKPVGFVMFKEDLDYKNALVKYVEITGDESGSMNNENSNYTKPEKLRITKEQFNDLKSRTSFNGKMKDGSQYRGLEDWVLQFYGHRIEHDVDGSIKAVYYPETKDGKIVGYKSRHLPKRFGIGNLGATGADNDLSGMHKFPNGGRFVIIVGGEEDKVAAQQMFREYQISKNQSDYDHYAVVSPTSGENSAAKQCAKHYDWLDKFDNIIVCMDNDEAGRKASVELVKVLPKDKVKVMSLSGKDPNQMLLEGKQKQFISNFWDAKEVIGSTLKTSKDADCEMEEELGRKSIPLPPFMKDVEVALSGGIRLGYLMVWAAQTGGGKSTIVNEMIYYWLFNSPYKIGILSLELNAGQYQSTMLSRHIGVNINKIPDPEERVNFVKQDWVVEKRKELRESEYGEPRFSLLDERDGSLDKVKIQIEKMIKRDNCKVVVIDPIQDLFESVPLEDQTSFIKWLKNLVKDGITVIAIAHITKGRTEIDRQTGKRMMRVLSEDDLAGVSNLAKSSGCTILLSRDKYADDPFERNLTYPTIGKCRWSGFTGETNPWYYDPVTHTMYDKNDYLERLYGKTELQEVVENKHESYYQGVTEDDF